MTHGVQFLQDLAVVMIIAGITSAIFHKIKQPTVLGYILAGLVIGPHTPPFKLISNQETVHTMAELGMIFLMFGMGLHFSFRKLFKVGLLALVAATFEILIMLWLGYQIGQYFSWSKMDSIFLGGILSISSTTIIVKTLMDLKMTNKPFSELIFGILVIEDILGIALIVLLSSMAMTGSVTVTTLGLVSFKLIVFLTGILIFGLLIVPRILHFVYRFRNHEVFLITVLGLCFGVSLLTVKLGYSVALGAFMIGAIMAETREIKLIERLISPIKDMFSAVFFVAIGMLIDPRLLIEYSWPIAVISIAIIAGKVISCSGATLLSGYKLKIALPVGMGLAQIGEFSFIIAQLGQSLNVTSNFLYPITVMSSVLTTITTPYLIKSSEKSANLITRNCPTFLVRFSSLYRSWLTEFKSSTIQKSILRELVVQIFINLLLLTCILIVTASTAKFIDQTKLDWLISLNETFGIFWLCAMLLGLPLIVVSIRKLRQISDLVAETSIEKDSDIESQAVKLMSRSIYLSGIFLIFLWIFIVSVAILPQLPVLIMMTILLSLVGLMLRNSVSEIYEKAQNAITQLFVQQWKLSSSNTNELLEKLKGAEVESITIASESIAIGKLIRELDLREHSGASIIGIERNDQHIVNPSSDEKLENGDKIILIGYPEQLRRAREIF